MKYVDPDDKIKTVVAEKQPFKGVENYFTDSLLYQDDDSEEEPPVEESDSGNEADTELEFKEGLIFNDIAPLVIDFDGLNVTDAAGEACEVVFNNKLDFAYLSCVDSDSVISGTSTDVSNDPVLGLYANSSFHMPVHASHMTSRHMTDSVEAVFIVPARNIAQEDIVFGKVDHPSQTL